MKAITTKGFMIPHMTCCKIRAACKRGSDEEISDLIYSTIMIYMSEVRDTDFVDPREYLKVTGKVFEAVCPCCGNTIELDLKGVIEDSLKDQDNNK